MKGVVPNPMKVVHKVVPNPMKAFSWAIPRTRRKHFTRLSPNPMKGVVPNPMKVEIPDVRGAIHTCIPQRLCDYVQESRRAGRDRQESEATMVYGCIQGAGMAGEGGWEDAAEDMPEFVQGREGCRRVVVERMMDRGRSDKRERHYVINVRGER